MTIEHDGEFWPTRIAMLAGLARADALAIVLRPRDASFVTYAAHNVTAESVWDRSVESGLLGAALDGDSTDGAVAVTLADGRTATAMRALPVTWAEHRVGVLAALRVSRTFDDEDAEILGRLASLVALELVEENTFWRIQRSAAELEARTRASAELQEKAHEYAAKMATGPTLAIGKIKLATVLGGGMPFQNGMLYEHEAVGRLFASEDAREGVTAFTEKRKPSYKGK